MATIYEIRDDLKYFYDFISDPENTYDDQIIKDTLESLEGELEDKIEAYMHVMVQLETDADGLDKEIARLTARRDACRNPAKRMKETILQTLQAHGKPKIETEHFRLSVAKNGGLQPLKITGDVPAEYCKLEPDNGKIREALKSGELDFAHLEERGVHLSVR